jgi:hypothetical protein
MPHAPASEDRGDQGWLLATPTRRRRFVIALCAVVATVAVWNAPIPGFRDRYQDATRSAYQLVWLDQGWSYFSPDVGLVSPEVWMEIDRIDGSTERYDLPDHFPVFGTFRRYRWIKFDEAVAFGPEDFEPLLDHVAANVDDPETVASVHVVIARSAPTVGDHGPYDPDYTATRVASRALDSGSLDP